MNVIPNLRTSKSVPGTTCTISNGTGVVVTDPSLGPVADWLSAEAARLAGITLSGTPGTGTSIELVIEPHTPPPHATTGIRADGAPRDREHYSLDISGYGVRIAGASAEGVFRGATTLVHLLVHPAKNGQATLEGQSITDAPRFAWRGLSMDVVRTFHPVATVKKVIDLLALYKMNVLHLHLTDSEGWRFEVPSYPKLTEVSGQTARDGRPGGAYSQSDYAEILAHAAERFITIVPEFDSPGHTASILRAYPELGSADVHASAEAMRYLDPSIPGVWDLVGAVFEEMARVHPGARIHIGGDEAIAMGEDQFAAYMESALPLARATGKGIVAWQETARAGFSEGDLMQLWISPFLVEKVRQAMENPDAPGMLDAFPDPEVAEAFAKLFLQAPDDLPKALAQGANVIFSRADKLYLDTKYVEPSSDPSQEQDQQRVGLPPSVYENGTVRDAYEWDPETIEQGLPADRIAGIEGAIWCETITDEHDLMFQLLPRLAGVAEKGWSESREWADYHPRIASQRRLWDAMEVSYFLSSVIWPDA